MDNWHNIELTGTEAQLFEKGADHVVTLPKGGRAVVNFRGKVQDVGSGRGDYSVSFCTRSTGGIDASPELTALVHRLFPNL